MHTKKSVNSH